MTHYYLLHKSQKVPQA